MSGKSFNYNKSSPGAAFRPNIVYLFPRDIDWLRALSEEKWPCRTLPTFPIDGGKLFSSLVRHYPFFSLYRAFVESLASENASRLESMQMAEEILKSICLS